MITKISHKKSVFGYLIRYSKKNEFNEEIVSEYFEKEITLTKNKFDKSLLKEPFFFNK